jgi:hypothetical protein
LKFQKNYKSWTNENGQAFSFHMTSSKATMQVSFILQAEFDCGCDGALCIGSRCWRRSKHWLFHRIRCFELVNNFWNQQIQVE